ncbi:hypothetical protein LCGC14_0504250 [marine sediment metagenome]|uniref:Uncharacterized protein n=1 Tax=marine sediment metagenome TaxID=412755 RepID=A0A0F9S2V1_9ZZZZ
MATRIQQFPFGGGGGGGLDNVIEDLTPQLGGNLDTNNFRILVNTGRGIYDQNNNEQLTFTQSVDAVGQFVMQNAAAGINPRLITGGGPVAIGMDIETKGTGELRLQPGNVDAIRLSNTPGIGFFGITPVARPIGVAVTDVAIHAALVTLGLITA